MRLNSSPKPKSSRYVSCLIYGIMKDWFIMFGCYFAFYISLHLSWKITLSVIFTWVLLQNIFCCYSAEMIIPKHHLIYFCVNDISMLSVTWEIFHVNFEINKDMFYYQHNNFDLYSDSNQTLLKIGVPSKRNNLDTYIFKA